MFVLNTLCKPIFVFHVEITHLQVAGYFLVSVCNAKLHENRLNCSYSPRNSCLDKKKPYKFYIFNRLQFHS